jgi:hypothetical protein
MLTDPGGVSLSRPRDPGTLTADRTFIPSISRVPAPSAVACNADAGRKLQEAAMPKEVTREELQHLVDRGAQLVEVLPDKEYEEDHLPGAINLPLRRLEKTALNMLEAKRPVIVYCWDIA